MPTILSNKASLYMYNVNCTLYIFINVKIFCSSSCLCLSYDFLCMFMMFVDRNSLCHVPPPQLNFYSDQRHSVTTVAPNHIYMINAVEDN